MRIGIHCNHYGFDEGSITLNVRKYATLLTKKGHEVHIFTKIQNNEIESKENGFYIHRFFREEGKINTISYFNRVIEAMRHLKLDILHEHELCGIGMLAKRRLGLPYVIYGRGWDIFDNRFIAKRLIKRSLSNCNRFIALSQYMADYARKTFKHSNTSVIYNGIELSKFKAKYNPKPHSLLYVNSDLRATKYPDKVIYAALFLSNRFKDIKLIMVGDGQIKAELEKLAADLGISDKVTFTGHLTNKKVIELMKRSSILVHPTKHTEACPNVLVEGIASGITILTTPDYGNNELIYDGHNGDLMEGISDDEISEKINRIWEHSSVSKLFRKNNDKLKKQFDIRKKVDELEKVYLEVLNETKECSI